LQTIIFVFLFWFNARFLLYYTTNQRSLLKLELNDDEHSPFMALGIGCCYV